MKDESQHLKIKYKFWIETSDNQSILGEGKWQLLKAIKDTGSLKAATEKMGYAYRQTWDKLKAIEEKLGFALIEKSRGGIKGGETVLTDKGERIVEFFNQLYSQTEADIQLKLNNMLKELNEIAE